MRISKFEKERDGLIRLMDRLDYEIIPEQKKTIMRYHSSLRAKNISEGRILKITRMLRKIGQLLNKPFEDATKGDIELVLAEINSSTCDAPCRKNKPLSAHTKLDYCKLLRQFYKWVRNVKVAPEEVEWIKTRLSQKEKNLNFDLITWGDVNGCIKASNNIRDIALVNFLYESGARVGEILNMKNRDIIFSDKFARVRLDGKTGERWIPIVTSSTYLAQYKQTKTSISDEEYFWVSIGTKNREDPLEYHAVVMVLKKLFARASIKKRCNPHSFRHSRATELAKTITESQMRLYFGWDKSSDTPSTYIHLSGRDIDNTILSMSGIVDEAQKEKEKVKNCSLCGNINAPHSSFCSKCGYGLSTESIINLEEKKSRDIDDAMKFMMEIAKDPEMMKRFEEFKESLLES